MVKQFSGKTYELESTKNMEAFLKAYGVTDPNALKGASTTKSKMSVTVSGDQYTQEVAVGNRVSKVTFKVGAEVEETTLDGEKCSTTFTLKSDDTLHQVQKFPDGRTVITEKKFTPTHVHATLNIGNVTAKRTYKAV